MALVPNNLISLLTAYLIYMAAVVSADYWDDPAITWDEPGVYWDSDSDGPYPAYIDQYINLLAMQHIIRQKFRNTVAGCVQPNADQQVTLYTIPSAFDLDSAKGAQLDIDSLWIAPKLKRNIVDPPFDDDKYRLVLKAKVGANKWNGSIENAQAIMDSLFEALGYGVLIQDFEDMHMVYALTGPAVDLVTKQLFKGGYLNLKPDGVTIDAYMVSDVPGTPYFGFDVDNGAIAGAGIGAWGDDR